MDFSGQVAVVTGGTSGIGREVVRMLAERGAHVIAGYDKHDDPALFDQYAGLSGEVVAQRGDIYDRVSAEAFIAASLERRDRIDALITCGVSVGYATFGDLSLEQWRATLTTNLDSVYHVCKAALRPMMKRRYGRIVTVSALHGEGGSPGQADFSAATGGVFGLTRALAREAAPWNITANAVAAGFVAPEILEVTPDAMRVWGEQIIALRRIGKPEEAAAAAVFFASPLASYITGQTLAVDGGWRMT